MKVSEKNKDFFEKVYQVVELIPKGRVSNYGSIAKYLGANRGARMVGWAINGCLKARPDLPAHRVVNRNGVLTGKMHFSSENEMQNRLESEGLIIIDDSIQDFEKHFWDPMLELWNS